jgi:hypothetical protein
MLRVGVLGELTVEVDGRAVELPRAWRAHLVLAWLALHPGTHRRAMVASRCWSSSAARGSPRRGAPAAGPGGTAAQGRPSRHRRRRHRSYGLRSEVPAAAREVIRHRLARFGDDCRQLLTIGAVVGREFEVRLLRSMPISFDRAASSCISSSTRP